MNAHVHTNRWYWLIGVKYLKHPNKCSQHWTKLLLLLESLTERLLMVLLQSSSEDNPFLCILHICMYAVGKSIRCFQRLDTLTSCILNCSLYITEIVHYIGCSPICSIVNFFHHSAIQNTLKCECTYDVPYVCHNALRSCISENEEVARKQ